MTRSPQPTSTWHATAALALLALLVAACVPSTTPGPEACADPTVDVAVRLTSDGLEPGTPSVCRDQAVTLTVASEVDGVLHVHGYDEEVPAFEVAAGDETEITFDATRAGQFPIEFHPADDPEGVGVGVFTVHEP